MLSMRFQYIGESKLEQDNKWSLISASIIIAKAFILEHKKTSSTVLLKSKPEEVLYFLSNAIRMDEHWDTIQSWAVNICPAYWLAISELCSSAALTEATDRIAPVFQLWLFGGSDRSKEVLILKSGVYSLSGTKTTLNNCSNLQLFVLDQSGEG